MSSFSLTVTLIFAFASVPLIEMPTNPKRSPSREASGLAASSSSGSTGRTLAVARMSEGKS